MDADRDPVIGPDPDITDPGDVARTSHQPSGPGSDRRAARGEIGGGGGGGGISREAIDDSPGIRIELTHRHHRRSKRTDPTDAASPGPGATWASASSGSLTSPSLEGRVERPELTLQKPFVDRAGL